MENRGIPSTWKAVLKSGSWVVQDEDGQVVATVGKIGDVEATAKLIAASPYILEALKGVVELIGDEDLSDNGEYSGAAVCDMVRVAVELANT